MLWTLDFSWIPVAEILKINEDKHTKWIYGGFQQWGAPKWMVYSFIQWKIPLKWMIWGYPYFGKPPYWIWKKRWTWLSKAHQDRWMDPATFAHQGMRLRYLPSFEWDPLRKPGPRRHQTLAMALLHSESRRIVKQPSPLPETPPSTIIQPSSNHHPIPSNHLRNQTKSLMN